ncbi:hypothetical protein GJ496_000614 [Pomphorhynchus laevis]|nr:hypothetical protein GJ496_000614 [Pomphorhynchus laevis]
MSSLIGSSKNYVKTAHAKILPAHIPDPRRNYKLISDPYLRPGHKVLFRYDGLSNQHRSPIQVCDPRKLLKSSKSSLSKRLSVLPIPDYAVSDFIGKVGILQSGNLSSPSPQDCSNSPLFSPTNSITQQQYSECQDYILSVSTKRIRKHHSISTNCSLLHQKKRRRKEYVSASTSSLSTPNFDNSSPALLPSSSEPKESLDSRIAALLGDQQQSNADQAEINNAPTNASLFPPLPQLPMQHPQQILQTGPTQNFLLNSMFVQGGINLPIFDPNRPPPPLPCLLPNTSTILSQPGGHILYPTTPAHPATSFPPCLPSPMPINPPMISPLNANPANPVFSAMDSNCQILNTPLKVLCRRAFDVSIVNLKSQLRKKLGRKILKGVAYKCIDNWYESNDIKNKIIKGSKYLNNVHSFSRAFKTEINETTQKNCNYQTPPMFPTNHQYSKIPKYDQNNRFFKLNETHDLNDNSLTKLQNTQPVSDEKDMSLDSKSSILEQNLIPESNSSSITTLSDESRINLNFVTNTNDKITANEKSPLKSSKCGIDREYAKTDRNTVPSIESKCTKTKHPKLSSDVLASPIDKSKQLSSGKLSTSPGKKQRTGPKNTVPLSQVVSSFVPDSAPLEKSHLEQNECALIPSTTDTSAHYLPDITSLETNQLDTQTTTITPTSSAIPSEANPVCLLKVSTSTITSSYSPLICAKGKSILYSIANSKIPSPTSFIVRKQLVDSNKRISTLSTKDTTFTSTPCNSNKVNTNESVGKVIKARALDDESADRNQIENFTTAFNMKKQVSKSKVDLNVKRFDSVEYNAGSDSLEVKSAKEANFKSKIALLEHNNNVSNCPDILSPTSTAINLVQRILFMQINQPYDSYEEKIINSIASAIKPEQSESINNTKFPNCFEVLIEGGNVFYDSLSENESQNTLFTSKCSISSYKSSFDELLSACQLSQSKSLSGKKISKKRTVQKFTLRSADDELKNIRSYLEHGIDAEDIGFLKQAYIEIIGDVPIPQWLAHVHWIHHPPSELQNDEGCARSLGRHMLSPTKRNVQYGPPAAKFSPVPEKIRSKKDINIRSVNRRECRSMQRRLMANIGDTDFAEIFRFSQFKLRKKRLQFGRSRIHDWGLFSCEYIAAEEMVIEYVGETIRQTVADKREHRQSVNDGSNGSSYLFRVDSDIIIDATHCGNLARFINHSCDPNCYAKIITVDQCKKVVIYSKREIQRGEEITYDYKFPIEDKKIPCACGATNCRKTLN